MPAERTLPIAAEHREFTVKVDGEVVAREHALVAVSALAAVNRVAIARLTYADGAADAGDFALSSAGRFHPGAAVELLAGGGAQPTLVFAGTVTGQRLQVREAAPAQLVVDCRHAADRLARVRRSANFFEQTDSDAIEALLGAGDVAADVEPTSVVHAQLVQHDCSDWDFIVTRASANGLLVLTRGARLAVRAPALGDALAELQHGATLLELDAEVDARQQVGQVQAASWNAADQALQLDDAATPAFRPPGDFDPDALAAGAGRPALRLVHAALEPAEAAAWADANWQRSRVDLASGRAKCVGIATIQPGDTVRLGGVGRRFGGDVLVTGVHHVFDTRQGWKTHLQFGGSAPEPALRQRLQAHRTAALLAPVAGLQAGVVTDNEDPQGEFRVRVRLPLVHDGDDGVWARVASLDAGARRGFVFRPEVGDEVLLGFLDDDPRRPVLLGMLHSSAMAPPLAPSNDNHRKGYTSRSGIELMFDDDAKSVRLATPGGNRLVLDDDAQGVSIEDQHGNRIVLGRDGIAIESRAALDLKAAAAGTLDAGTTLDVTASAALRLQGTASTDVKSGGVVQVAGSAVQLG